MRNEDGREGAQVRVVVCHEQKLVRDLLALGLGRRGMDVVASVAPDGLVVRPGFTDTALVAGSRRTYLPLVQRLRDGAPEVATVVLADAGNAAAVADAFAAGARGFVTQATSMNDLARCLLSARRGHGSVSGLSLGGVLDHLVHTTRPARGAGNALTGREREVLDLLVEGCSTSAIATRLGVSPHTARCHIKAVLSKLEVRTRGEAAALAVRRQAV